MEKIELIATENSAPDDIFGPDEGSPDSSAGFIESNFTSEPSSLAGFGDDDLALDVPAPVKEVKVPEMFLTPSKADIVAQKELIEQIATLKNYFPDKLDHIPKPSELRKKSIEELDAIYFDAQIDMAASSNCQTLYNAGLHGVSAIEAIGPMVGLKMHGLSNACRNSPEFDQALKEVAVKYGKQIQVEPEYKLAISIVSAMTAVHTLNKTKEEAAAKSDLIVDSEIEEAGKDL